MVGTRRAQTKPSTPGGAVPNGMGGINMKRNRGGARDARFAQA